MQLPAPLDIAVANVNHFFRQTGRTPIFLLLLWFTTLWWGERNTFSQSAAACSWHRWESWPAAAEPHHVLLVADPQIVDPHTYPGRPWPLSTLTVWITDLYMRRTYNHLLHHLQPHSTIFLGDLFDGGREWGTAGYKSPELRYRRYGSSFWLKEYNRFMNLFVKSWHKHELHKIPSSEGRHIIASLPGNHDIGFADGINPHVKNRFDAHFGSLNRVDVLGNHSFVSVDTVSLSAMDRADPATGSSGAGDGTAADDRNAKIWKPVESFLENVHDLRSKAVQRRYQHFDSITNGNQQRPSRPLFEPQFSTGLEDSVDVDQKETTKVPTSNFPTVLLTHVPMYRDQDVPCGPLRERGNSIPLSAGYQYQNVLTPMVSSDIIKHLNANEVTMIYSGDDHDYCEIEHGEFTGRIREITVKSTSMAMGIRRPGVQLASLWNPIDMEGIANGRIDPSTPRDTVQNHLCLLPFMGGIFLRYAAVLVLTLIILAIRATIYDPQSNIYQQPSSFNDRFHPLLPLSAKDVPAAFSRPTARSDHSTTSTPSSARARSTRQSITFTPPSDPSSPIRAAGIETDDWGYPASTSTTTSKQRRRSRSTSHFSLSSWTRHLHRSPTRIGEFLRSLYLVAAPVLLFYFWLLWND